MNTEEMVVSYFDAWNRKDVAGLLELMHGGAAYYDAFWRENCVGRDLDPYLEDSLKEDSYVYRQVGALIKAGQSVAFRYTAHEGDDSGDGPLSYSGAEVLTLRDGKILTVSDYYCDPDDGYLKEVALIESRRHGESKYAQSGLSERRSLQLERRIFEIMGESPEPDLTALQLATELDCTVEQLLQVVEKIRESNEQDPDVRWKPEYEKFLQSIVESSS